MGLPGLSGAALIRHNRLLLEDAYPQQIVVLSAPEGLTSFTGALENLDQLGTSPDPAGGSVLNQLHELTVDALQARLIAVGTLSAEMVITREGRVADMLTTGVLSAETIRTGAITVGTRDDGDPTEGITRHRSVVVLWNPGTVASRDSISTVVHVPEAMPDDTVTVGFSGLGAGGVGTALEPVSIIESENWQDPLLYQGPLPAWQISGYVIAPRWVCVTLSNMGAIARVASEGNLRLDIWQH